MRMRAPRGRVVIRIGSETSPYRMIRAQASYWERSENAWGAMAFGGWK